MDAVTARRIVLMFLGLVILTTGLTLVFLSMRAVMDIGGMCATGGPYVVATPCPDGVAALMPLGIIGGLAGLWLYAVNSSKLPGPRLVFLAWSALFLSLGWNFWEFGLNPPDGSDGVVWGWIICGVTFLAMGGLPLLGLTSRGIAKQVFWADAPTAGPRVAVTAPAGPSVAAGNPDSLGDALEQLARLHSSGALSDEEYRMAKQRILGGHG
jgi:hypothetical protein